MSRCVAKTPCLKNLHRFRFLTAFKVHRTLMSPKQTPAFIEIKYNLYPSNTNVFKVSRGKRKDFLITIIFKNRILQDNL